MISGSKGFVLVTSLILTLILSCIVLPMLIQAELSQKLAGSATLAFQVRQQTQSKHNQQLQKLKQDELESATVILAPCPALYAPWSEVEFECEWHQLRTTELSAVYQHSMTSFLVRQSLPEGGRDGGL